MNLYIIISNLLIQKNGLKWNNFLISEKNKKQIDFFDI